MVSLAEARSARRIPDSTPFRKLSQATGARQEIHDPIFSPATVQRSTHALLREATFIFGQRSTDLLLLPSCFDLVMIYIMAGAAGSLYS
jgi:hypothetical protein